jgi:ElaB/YqjD/DUF883 family membrane-anchored ribosome-binding protein
MVAETNVIKQKPEALRAEMEETRTNLTDKLETLEQGIKDTWQGATAAVTDTVEGVKATVESTVQAVQGAVQDTTEAVGRAFDLPAHVRRHPWLMMGGALLLGIVVGNLVGRRRW